MSIWYCPVCKGLVSEPICPKHKRETSRVSDMGIGKKEGKEFFEFQKSLKDEFDKMSQIPSRLLSKEATMKVEEATQTVSVSIGTKGMKTWIGGEYED